MLSKIKLHKNEDNFRFILEIWQGLIWGKMTRRSLKAEKFEKTIQSWREMSEKWSYWSVSKPNRDEKFWFSFSSKKDSISSLENSRDRGSNILLQKILQTYHAKLPALSLSDVIKSNNIDWIRELPGIIWLDKNTVKWYRIFGKNLETKMAVPLKVESSRPACPW